MMVRLSQGTAAVAGLKEVRLSVAPTTASIMIGEHCSQNCSFCTQSRSSQAKEGFLSRVPWPEFPAEEVISKIAESYRQKKIKRACLQVVANKKALDDAKVFLRKLRSHSPIPLSISCKVDSLDDLRELFDIGVERVGIALDAASVETYRNFKGGDLKQKIEFLVQAVQEFPGKIATHLIAGLGETEEEMVKLLQLCYSKGIRVGLFAFTPVKGSALADKKPPDLSSYRRIQAARFLIEKDYYLADKFTFQSGKLTNLRIDLKTLREYLGEGTAFRTAGCPDCNRPFYNERPGDVLYNYPRPLTPEELEKAIGDLDLIFNN